MFGRIMRGYRQFRNPGEITSESKQRREGRRFGHPTDHRWAFPDARSINLTIAGLTVRMDSVRSSTSFYRRRHRLTETVMQSPESSTEINEH